MSDDHPSTFQATPENIDSLLSAAKMRFDAGRHTTLLAIAVIAARGAWGPEPGWASKIAMGLLLMSALTGVFHFWWAAYLASALASRAWGCGQHDQPRAVKLVEAFGKIQMLTLIAGLALLGAAFILA